MPWWLQSLQILESNDMLDTFQRQIEQLNDDGPDLYAYNSSQECRTIFCPPGKASSYAEFQVSQGS